MAESHEPWGQWIQTEAERLFLALNTLSSCRVHEVQQANILALQDAARRFDQPEVRRLSEVSTLLAAVAQLRGLYEPIRKQFSTIVEVHHERH